MKRNISILKHMILALVSLAAVSCMPDRDIPGPDIPASDRVNIRFRMSMPKPGLKTTRAADDGEFAVNNISLLVFVQEGGAGNFTYRYTAVGRKLDQPDNTAVDFEALLVDSEDPVRLLAVANCADGFLDNIEEGATEAAVRSALISDDHDFSQGLPMTGAAQLASLSEATGIVRIPLVRSVAKVSVAVRLDGGSSAFIMTSVEIRRTPEYWQCFPDAGNIENEIAAPMPLAPSVPNPADTLNRGPYTVDGSQFYSGYVHETAIPSGLDDGVDPATRAMCIIVGGRFADDEQVTYYRLDCGNLVDPANPVGQVLRNYWYEFTIVGAESRGRATAQQAAASPAYGLRTTATPWNGGGNTDFYFGENDYIKLSADSMELAIQSGSTATMTVTTSGVPFTVTSVHYPGDGQLDTADPDLALETDKIRFEMTSLPPDRPGEQKWQLTATSLATESVVDYLQLHAADGLMTINIFIQRNPPPGHTDPDPDDPTKRRIRVLTLGTNTYGSLNRQTNRGVPAMLRNTSYFGPTGTVPCAGIDILPTVTTETDANAIRTALEGADIIVTSYAYHPNADVSHVIYEWITQPNSGRVAFLTSDDSSIIEHLRAYLDGRMVWRYNPVANLGADPATEFGYGPGYTGIELSTVEAADPFLVGVFGNARACTISRPRPYDAASQYINTASANSVVVPLMVATGNSGPNNSVMLMGVDPERHIVYIGDAILFHTEGIGTTANSSLAYDSANYINAMWANTWAWAIGRVMEENYHADGAMVE